MKTLINPANKFSWRTVSRIWITFVVVLLVCGSLLIFRSSPAQVIAETEATIVVQDAPSISVLTLNPHQATTPEQTLNLTFHNKVAFTTADVPQVKLRDFESSGSEGEIEFLTATEAADHTTSALAWLTLSVTQLTNLAQGATNVISLPVNVPTDQAVGNYTAALVFENADGDVLGQQLIIINVGSVGQNVTSPKLDLVDELTEVKPAEGVIRVGLKNPGQWYLDPLVKLVLVPKGADATDAEAIFDYELQQPQRLGIFAKTQQVYTLPEDQQADFIKRFKANRDGQFDLLAFHDRTDETTEPDEFDLEISTATADDDDDQTSETEPAQAAPTTPPATTPTPPASSSSMLSLPVIGGAVGGLVLIGLGAWYVLRRRKQATFTPVASPPAPAPPQPAAPQPADTLATAPPISGIELPQDPESGEVELPTAPVAPTPPPVISAPGQPDVPVVDELQQGQ